MYDYLKLIPDRQRFPGHCLSMETIKSPNIGSHVILRICSVRICIEIVHHNGFCEENEIELYFNLEGEGVKKEKKMRGRKEEK